MSDIFLFLLALLFIGVTAPFWAIIGLVWSVLLFLWADLRLVIGLLLVFSSSIFGWPGDGNITTAMFADNLLQCFFMYLLGLWDAVISFFDPVGYLWDFARYDHPWWALFISIALGIFWISVIKSDK
jgi:hypothetical protein